MSTSPPDGPSAASTPILSLTPSSPSTTIFNIPHLVAAITSELEGQDLQCVALVNRACFSSAAGRLFRTVIIQCRSDRRARDVDPAQWPPEDTWNIPHTDESLQLPWPIAERLEQQDHVSALGSNPRERMQATQGLEWARQEALQHIRIVQIRDHSTTQCVQAANLLRRLSTVPLAKIERFVLLGQYTESIDHRACHLATELGNAAVLQFDLLLKPHEPNKRRCCHYWDRFDIPRLATTTMDQQAIVPKAVIRLSGTASEPLIEEDTAHTIVVLLHDLHGCSKRLAPRLFPFLHAGCQQLIIVNDDMMTALDPYTLADPGSPMTYAEAAHAMMFTVRPGLCEAAKLVFMSREQYRATSTWDPEDDTAMAWPAGSMQ